MIGIDATDGQYLGDLDHLRQSIRDILTTPIGTRVMRRDYGSRLFKLVDSPTNPESLLDWFAATAEALDAWEPRFRLTQVHWDGADSGHLTLRLDGVYLPDGREITLEGIEV